MAQIDSGIYNALMQPQRSALDYAEQFAQADDRKAQRAFNALAMQEKQAALGDQSRARDVNQRLQTGLQGLGTGASDDQRIGLYESLGQFDAADKIRQGIISRRKAETEAQKGSADVATKFVSLQGELAKRVQAVPTPENAMAAIQHMRSYAKLFGLGDIDLSNEERQVQAFGTPEDIQRWAAGHAITAEKLLPQISSHNIGGSTITQAVDPLTGKPQTTGVVANTQSPDNKATQATTVRGQNLTDARARDALKQSDQHFQATQGAGVKMTEDQGKATGWLIQAENAWKNMQAAIDPKTGGGIDAAKPGLNDALAAIPSLGLTTSIANSMRGENRQKFMQGASSLSEAMLRAATGAGVNKDEAAQKIRELTPVFGDDDATIKQKMDAIPLYIESLKVRAGPGASKANVVLNSSGVAPNTARSVVNVKPGGVIRFDAQGNMIP